MTKKLLLTLCLSLLCGAASDAQTLSPFVARQVRIDRLTVPRTMPRFEPPRVFAPARPSADLRRLLDAAKQARTPRFNPQSLGDPIVRRPASPFAPRTVLPVAVVAAARPKSSSSVRTVDAGRLIVRPNPGSWYLDALKKGDKFTVKAVRGPWAYGNSNGAVDLKGVWVLREGLTKGAVPSGKGNPPYKLRDHAESRAFMKKNYASWLSPGVADGQKVKLRQATSLVNSYNPKTGTFSGVVKKLDPKTPNRELRVRAISKDGKAAVVRYNGVDKNGKATKLTQWGIVPCAQLKGTNGRSVHCK